MPAASAELHISYSNDVQDYDLSYDDRKLGGYDMLMIVWLSPWYNPVKESPYEIAWSFDAKTKVVDKFFFVRSLESRVGPLSDANEKADYEARAEMNISKGRHDIESLRGLKLPAILEPVRGYLLNGLKFFLEEAEERYRYIESGEVQPLRSALCKACPCGAPEERLLAELEGVDDFAKRAKRSYADWPNAMLACRNRRHIVYPVASWEAFLKNAGARETSRNKSPE
jgi:hypothetical protein